MNTSRNAIGVVGATLPRTIKVWDPLVRLFHWSLVTLFLAAYLTGDDAGQMHFTAGYAIAGLIGLRIVWGFIRPRYARFRNFVRSPREVIGYIRDVATFTAPRYLGHNLAGGVMIIALLVLLLGTGLTGYLMTTDAFWGAKWVEQVHEALANLTVGLIVFHIVGVIISSLKDKENLLKSMITGYKRQT